MSSKDPDRGRQALGTVFRPPVIYKNLLVALIVGTILTIINQGDIIMGGDIYVWKVVLTYIVPFLVSSYGAYSALSARGSDHSG